MIWPLIDIKYEELDQMETTRRRVCNGSFGYLKVRYKKATYCKWGFYIHMRWPGLGVVTGWLQLARSHRSPLGGGPGALWLGSAQPKVPVEKPQRTKTVLLRLGVSCHLGEWHL